MATLAPKLMAPRPRRRRKWWKLLLYLLLMAVLAVGVMGWAYWRAWIRPAPQQEGWAGPLTVEQRHEIFDSLWHEVDWRYSYLDLKAIDWSAQKERFRPLAEAAPDDEAFYGVLQEMLATLQDGHTYLVSYPGFAGESGTAVNLVLAEGQFVVAADVTGVPVAPGDVVLAVDGRPAADVAADLRKITSASTEAQMEAELAQRLLSGLPGSTVQVRFRRSSDGSEYDVELRRQGSPAQEPSFDQRMVEGFGYIKVGQLGGDVVRQFDQALESFRNAPGLILDLRGNGGGNDRLAEEMIGRLIQEETSWAKIQLRMAPFWSPRITRTVSPRGEWQYTGPVVMLIDGRVYSSADFFAGGLARSGRVTAVGSATGGGSGNPIRLTLPGGAQVNISRWIEYFADGTPVEGNGTQPDVIVRPTIADIAAGRDPALLKAIELLKQAN